MRGELPDKLSELIDLAVSDLEACEQDYFYEISMGTWHLGMVDNCGRCAVCMAGTVMAKTLDVRPTETTTPGNARFYGDQRRRLEAIDDARRYDVDSALRLVGYGACKPVERCMEGVKPVSYFSDKDGFKKSMRQLAANLRKVNL